MCGRFVGFTDVEQLKQHFPIDKVNCEHVANYNVAPSQQILSIAQMDGLNVLEKFHWGLVPHWAKDKSIGSKMVNARSETISEKPSFRDAFKKRRCLILADAFYEWKGQKGAKQPFFITLPEKLPFAFAGLWEIWHDKQKQEAYRSCTIITRESVGKMRKIHHRMPVILQPDAFNPWLALENTNTDELNRMLLDKSITELVFHSVGKQVNSVKNNDPSNLQPVQTEFDF